MRFEHQVALVTGAASGIGRALVQRLVAEGAAVVAVDLVEAPLQALVANLRDQGAMITGCPANVASDTDVEAMLSTATSTYGRLDILCNNAGIMDLMTPAAEVPLDLWERVLAVNLHGPFLACRQAIPMFIEQGGGSIVNTASEAGLRGGAAGTAYTVAKHGVVGLTRSIAFHYGEQGIRCNAVCPGAVATAIGMGNGVPNEAGLSRVLPFLKGSANIVLISLPAIFNGIGINPLAPGETNYPLRMLLGYMMVTATLVVVFGRISDMFGRVKLYNLGFAIFTLGLVALQPSSLSSGLEQVGLSASTAHQIASLPPLAALFAAFLGYNPMGTLLPQSTLHQLPAASQAQLLGQSFFPNQIAGPFMLGLHVAFYLAAVLCLIGAFASLVREKRPAVERTVSDTSIESV